MNKLNIFPTLPIPLNKPNTSFYFFRAPINEPKAHNVGPIAAATTPNITINLLVLDDKPPNHFDTSLI